MSSIVRFAIICMCCTAMLGLDASVGVAQGPPDIDGQGPKGNNSRGRDAQNRNGRGDRDGNDSRGSRGSRGDKAKQAPAKKFDDLIADVNLNKFRGYASETIGDGWKFEGKYLCYDGTGGGDIITKETYTDFDLQFKWKISEGGNSGVMYRVSLGDKAPYFSGPEYQLLDDAAHADGKNPLTSSGSLYGLYAPTANKSKKAGEWNFTKIVVEGNKVTHYLNYKKIVEAEIGSDDWKEKVGESKFKSWEKFGKNKSGHIAFQDHGNRVLFREIRIKRLNDEEAPAEEKTASADSNPATNATVESKGPRRIGGKVIMGRPDDLDRGAGLNPGGKKKDDDDKKKGN